ncbi:amidase family protein [Patulibacter sp. NPDC049589]|uniref:amidase family protein n=1 Tax=Patulibacter sp. NPDC049589 TaxID=3154731 RepID=UPI00343287C1
MASAAPTLDLETLTAPQAEQMMEAGTLTSVELTQAYIDRITALNKRGPGLNAVTQFNKDAMREAAASDVRRKAGALLGPTDGLPILMKDLIDVKGMYTSNGNYSLRNSYPEKDAGLVKHLRERGVVILGKLGLSEFANFFGSQHSGFSNLTGQVINAVDADQGPSGSSSGSGAAGAAAMSALTIGTETSGSIISPSAANGLVGLRPTVGLVPGVGIGPISAAQDTAGPMDRTVENAAMTLQSIAGYDAENADYYTGIWGPGVDDEDVIPPVPADVPDYLSALDLDFVDGKRVGWNGTRTEGSTLDLALDALEDAGAILVERAAKPLSAPIPSGFSLNYEAKRDITHYYQHLGANAPIKSLAEEIATNQEEAAQALKFGNSTHTASEAIDISDDSAASVAYRTGLVEGKRLTHEQIESTLDNGTDDPSDDVIAVVGSVGGNGARAGYPQLTIPMGYSDTARRALSLNIHGDAYSERDLIGVAFAIEQGTQLREPVSEVNPSMYRCAKTVPAPPYADRGACNPDYDEAMAAAGDVPDLGFSLETETAQSLMNRLNAKRISSETLTRAYLARIARVNAEGPAIQAVRALNPDAIAEAKASDEARAGGQRRRLEGLPILLSDVIDVDGMTTTGGSIALQDSKATDDAALVAKLKAAGAIILGKTNVSELGGVFDGDMPEGYSSLGGQVLLPVDTDNNVGGSSAGAAAATSTGLAAMTVGTETSTDTSQMIAPAGLAGVVALKPTVGRVGRTGILPTATSQDSPGPITQSVYDAAMQLQAIAGTDPGDPATTGAPAVPNYLAGLTPTALSGRRLAYVASTTVPFPGVLTTLQGLGATTDAKTFTAPSTPSIARSELKRDLNAYLAGTTGTGAKSLQEIIDYNDDHEAEGLKFQQEELTTAQAVDLTDPATKATYETNRDAGKAASAAVIDGILTNGTPATTDDYDVIVVPSGNALVNVADRAGYPVLTVPAGYGTGSSGGNPQSVTFIGPAYGEARLLADGYAFEQATKVRKAPSVTNPSMFRCVTGSTFTTNEKCNPGDRNLVFAFDPLDPDPVTPTTPAEPTTPTFPATPTTPAPAPAPTTPAKPAPTVAVFKPVISHNAVRATTRRKVTVRVRCGVTKGSKRCKGTIALRSGSTTLASRTFSITAGRTVSITLSLSKTGYARLVRRGSLSATVTLKARDAKGTLRTSTAKVAVRAPKKG